MRDTKCAHCRGTILVGDAIEVTARALFPEESDRELRFLLCRTCLHQIATSLSERRPTDGRAKEAR